MTHTPGSSHSPRKKDPASQLRLIALVCLALPLAAAPAPAAPEEKNPVPSAPRHSFLDPVGDFVSDKILKPVAPFELVPGQDPRGWGFVIEPYAWAMGLNGNIGVKGFPPSHLNMSSRTILQSLDWGIFARGEIRKGRWGLLADGYYAALSGSGNIENSIYDSVNLQVQQSIVSLALAYRVIDDRRGYLDIYAGARYNFIGTQADASLNDSHIDEISATATSAISSRIASSVDEAIQNASAAAGPIIAGLVGEKLGDHALRKIILENPDLRQLVRDGAILRSVTGGHIRQALREYLSAAASRLASAQGQFDAKLESAALSAKKKLQNAIADRIEESTNTYAAGNQWWFDPIIGARGQINLTRALFLAAQGDVGGFSAGSQIAWNVQATIGLNITRNLFAEVGYRYMYVDYTNGGFLYDMNSYGLYTGLGLKF